MPPLRDDYLLRMIEQAFQILRRMMRNRTELDLPDALAEVDAAIPQILGPSADVCSRLDAATAVPLLADPRRAAIWARLLAERAELLRLLQDPGAEAAWVRALQVAMEARELEREARILDAELGTALEDAIRMSAEHAPPDRLDARTSALLGPRASATE
jgi:hypothetical protein